MTLNLFRVYRSDRTRIDTDAGLLGWGVAFPSGECYVEWNRAAFPEEQQLDHPHVSVYGSFEDVEQGTGGEVVLCETFTGAGWSE